MTGPLLVGVSQYILPVRSTFFTRFFFARKSPVKYEWDDKSLVASQRSGVGEGEEMIEKNYSRDKRRGNT